MPLDRERMFVGKVVAREFDARYWAGTAPQDQLSEEGRGCLAERKEREASLEATTSRGTDGLKGNIVARRRW